MAGAPTSYMKYVQYAIALWTARHCIFMLGGMSKLCLDFMSSMVSTSPMPPYEIQYDALDENYDFVLLALMKNTPVVVKGVNHKPFRESILQSGGLRSLIQSAVVDDARSSMDGNFTYFSYKSPW
jgi:hypothetical protein